MRSLLLGVETTCDETAFSVVTGDRRVLSNAIATQHELHAEYAGVVPEIASRAHVERLLPTLRRALDEAGCMLDQVAAIAVADRPGLIGSLLVGLSAAKALAWSLGVPLIPVDHVHAHLFAPLLDTPASLEDLTPALGLVVSGGHTALYAIGSATDIRMLGSTIDDALGEAFDKAATTLGLGHPGGPLLERLAADGDDKAHAFPVSRLGSDSTEFSFSGLKTAVLYAVRGLPQRGGVFERDHTALSERQKADIAASFQRAAVGALALKLERAIDQWAGPKPRTLLAGGGVVANRSVRNALETVADRHGMSVMLPPMPFCTDNAAMVAGLATLLPIPEQGEAMSASPRATVSR